MVCVWVYHKIYRYIYLSFWKIACPYYALKARTEGVSIRGTIIIDIRFADDTAIMAETIKDLQD